MKSRLQNNCLKLAILFGLISIIGIWMMGCTMSGDKHIARGECRQETRLGAWMCKEMGMTYRYVHSHGVLKDGTAWFHVELEGQDTDGKWKRMYFNQPLDLYMEQ